MLITGGTGSFGNAMCRKLLKKGIGEIRIFSRDEKKQDDMRRLYCDKRLKFYIGNVRDYSSLRDALTGVDYVFHAAALKQVPSCEFYPKEALMTNALGAENVLGASIENDVKKIVVLSTDKAVYPINAMGISKAMMEKLMIAKARIAAHKGIIACGVRYGNVIASRGSVIPLFINQVRSGQPITITDPSMTRFMMSLNEAVDLVFYAFENARPGDIFVQKAPAATIEVLVKAIKKMFNADNPEQVIGTRHGEKLFETLLTREEMIHSEDLGDHFRIPADNRDLNYESYFSLGKEQITTSLDFNSHNTNLLTSDQLVKLLSSVEEVRILIDGVSQ